MADVIKVHTELFYKKGGYRSMSKGRKTIKEALDYINKFDPYYIYPEISSYIIQLRINGKSITNKYGVLK